MQVPGRFANVAHGKGHAMLHALQSRQQDADFIAGDALHRLAQVAIGDPVEMVGCAFERLQEQAIKQQPADGDEQDRGRQHGHGQQCGLVRAAFGGQAQAILDLFRMLDHGAQRGGEFAVGGFGADGGGGVVLQRYVIEGDLAHVQYLDVAVVGGRNAQRFRFRQCRWRQSLTIAVEGLACVLQSCRGAPAVVVGLDFIALDQVDVGIVHVDQGVQEQALGVMQRLDVAVREFDQRDGGAAGRARTLPGHAGSQPQRQRQ